jgi:1-deoxy-D-xylulose-5-phosphate synthase
VLLLGTGKMVAVAREAARLLQKDDVPAVAVNARFVKPLDVRLSEWASRASLVVTVEDNVVAGGFGASVAEALSAAGVHTRTLLLGVPDEFIAHANVDQIHARLGLDPEGVAQRVVAALDR